jgi:sugar-specific transcriptional regulator TrmB
MALATPVVNIEGIVGDALRHLQILGLNDYGPGGPVALPRDYPTTRDQLTQKAPIPESRFYEVVRRLQDKGALSGLKGRPPRFVPPLCKTWSIRFTAGREKRSMMCA